MIQPGRLALSIFGGSVAGGLVFALGAPLIAAVPAALLGASTTWLLDTGPAEPASSQPPAASDRSSDGLALARPYLAALMNAIDDPLLLIEQQRVAMANDAAIRLLGEHFVGQDARLAIRHPKATARLSGPIDPTAPPVRIADIGGPGRQWDFIVTGFGSDQRLVRMIDRSESHAAEKMRVDFVANSSHELRTPLATLIGFIETLEGDAGTDATTRNRFLEIMGREARRMRQLVDELISLSRIEAEKHNLPDAQIPLDQLIAEVVGQATPREDDQRVAIELRAEDPVVRGDRAQLSQMFHNLVSNALKYGRPGTPVRLVIDLPDAKMVRVAVIDEGEGIPPEHLPRLTERFYRVDAGRSRSVGGTGLGLAIVKHIVERHGGQLSIQSKVGIGSTILVTLPRAMS